MDFLRLPQPAQEEVIRNLDCMDQLSLSISSKKAMSAVRNVKINLDKINIAFGDRLKIELVFGKESEMRMDFMDAQNAGLRKLDPPQTVQFSSGGRVARLESFNLGLGSWIRHLFSVYSGKRLVNCKFDARNGNCDAGSIKRAFEEIKIRSIEISNHLPGQSFQLLVNSDISSDCVTIWGDEYRDELGLRKLLSQNLFAFHSFDHFPLYFSCLDNILSINSSMITIHDLSLSDKSLNRFLKLWKTGSMPRLEFLQLGFARNRVIGRNVVLKGVKHAVVPQNQQRHEKFEFAIGWLSYVIRGGVAIRREDGVKAIIDIRERNFLFYLLK